MAWLARYLAASDRRICIIEHRNAPAGILRLDPVENPVGFEVTVVTDPKMYRQGVGLPALLLARAWVPHVPLYAHVLPINEASKAMVLAAGYIEKSPGHFISAPLEGAAHDAG